MDVNRLTDLHLLLFPLSLNVFVYAHASGGVFTGHPSLPYPVWFHFTLQRMAGSTNGWTPGLDLLGLKVG
jgi:hypothetical protein